MDSMSGQGAREKGELFLTVTLSFEESEWTGRRQKDTNGMSTMKRDVKKSEQQQQEI